MTYDERGTLSSKEMDLPELDDSAIEPLEDDLPLIPGSELEVIKDGDGEEPLKTDANLTFENVDPEDERGLEAVASKIFARALENPQTSALISEHRKTQGLSFNASENPVDHPLFRLIADHKTTETMRDLARALRGEGDQRKEVKTRGNAEMRAVRFLLERIQEALEVYAKIQPSDVRATLGHKEKLNNERPVLQEVVHHAMKSYLTREESGWFEALIRSEQRRQMREGAIGGERPMLPARDLAVAKFVDVWLKDASRADFVKHVFAGLRAGTTSVENADLALQAEAVRELKETYKSKVEEAQILRTGTDR